MEVGISTVTKTAASMFLQEKTLTWILVWILESNLQRAWNKKWDCQLCWSAKGSRCESWVSQWDSDRQRRVCYCVWEVVLMCTWLVNSEEICSSVHLLLGLNMPHLHTELAQVTTATCISSQDKSICQEGGNTHPLIYLRLSIWYFTYWQLDSSWRSRNADGDHKQH